MKKLSLFIFPLIGLLMTVHYILREDQQKEGQLSRIPNKTNSVKRAKEQFKNRKVEKRTKVLDKETKEMREFEKYFDEKFLELESLTNELNKYSRSADAPKELRAQYTVARNQIIKIHKKYLNDINNKIKKLILKENQI